MRANLKVLRVKENLTQVEMAKKLGIGRSTYQAIEGGRSRGSENFGHKVQTTFEIPESEMGSLMQHKLEER